MFSKPINIIGILVIACLTAGCIIVPPRSKNPSGSPGARTEYVSTSRKPVNVVIDLNQNVDIIPTLARGAHRVGCRYEHEMKDGISALAVTCGDLKFGFGQRGRKLVVVCGNLDRQRCGKAASGILESGMQ